MARAPFLSGLTTRGRFTSFRPCGSLVYGPFQHCGIEKVPRYEPLLGLCALQRLRTMAFDLAHERGTQRSRTRPHSPGPKQTVPDVLLMDVSISSEAYDR